MIKSFSYNRASAPAGGASDFVVGTNTKYQITRARSGVEATLRDVIAKPNVKIQSRGEFIGKRQISKINPDFPMKE